MKVVVVSGIWPPDVGGPASHAPEAAGALEAAGHDVIVVTTATAAPKAEAYPVRWVPRSLPPGIRHLAAVRMIAAAARGADVVYATSMLQRSIVGAALARVPVVLKVAGDPAFERARRRGLYDGTLSTFATSRPNAATRILRLLRTALVRRAARVVVPSVFLAGIVEGWGVPASRISVIPNATPSPPPLPARAELRERLGVEGDVLGFAGRLTAAKALDVALSAVADVPDVTLLVAGDGEERRRLEEIAPPNVRFLGPLPRERVLEVLHAVDAVVLSSVWENFPHALVEALSVGTPVIATAVGGVGEIVEDEANGLLVPANDAGALTRAVRRFFSDDALRARLRAAAAPSAATYAPERVFARLEEVLLGVRKLRG